MIFAMIVGSGFASGKEIFVFFSRFGNLSYLYIFLACLLFFGLFYLFLTKGGCVVDRLEKSKVLNLVLIFISLVFCASMFAGLISLFSFLPKILRYLMIVLLLLFTLFTTIKGIRIFEKISLYLMPICLFVFLAVLVFISFKDSSIYLQTSAGAGILYVPLYVALNFSTGTIIVAKAGRGMNKKQTFLTSLFSTILLFAFLTFGNFVLRNHSESFYADMPFLYLCQGNGVFFLLCYSVIFVGCLTSLISLCLTLKVSLSGVLKNNLLNVLIAVFVPFIISELGFSSIVSNLYPLASVLGIFVLLFFICSFKQTDKIIHQEGKDTQNKRSTHY